MPWRQTLLFFTKVNFLKWGEKPYSPFAPLDTFQSIGKDFVAQYFPRKPQNYYNNRKQELERS